MRQLDECGPHWIFLCRVKSLCLIERALRFFGSSQQHQCTAFIGLRPGLFVRVALVLNERNDAIQVPEQALVPQGQDQFVFRVVDGKAALTKVTAGIRRNGMVEITEGLSPDDQVVTAGQLKIRDGAPVKPLANEA